jgi:hypothetical protein
MSSRIVTRIEPIMVTVIAAACFGTMAVPLLASAAPAAMTSAASPAYGSTAPKSDTPWPGP